MIGSCLDLASPTRGRILAAFNAACLQTHLASRQEKRVIIIIIIIIIIIYSTIVYCGTRVKAPALCFYHSLVNGPWLAGGGINTEHRAHG